MDNIKRMNEVIDYIENNILGEIDFSEISRIACCPAHQFQRVFSFVTDTTLTKYIKSRKLSLAAIELQQSKISIIDIALKYGYDSHASFTRAFREQHKISPSLARSKNVILNILPPMSFHNPTLSNSETIYRVEKGKIKMAELTKIDFLEFGPYKFIGKQIRTKPMTNDIARLWGQCFADGTFEVLSSMKDFSPPETPDAYVGYIHDYNKENNTFLYSVGFFMKHNTPVPDGFISCEIPKCTIATSWIYGEEYEIYSSAQELTVNSINQNGYEVDWENFFKCEVYTDARFSIPKNSGEKNLTLDVYIPCKKLYTMANEHNI